MTTHVLAQAVLALAVLARAVQRQSHPVNCSREVVIGALAAVLFLCDGQVVTFNKAELPRPWDSLGAVRAASGRINIQSSEKILRKVLCFLVFFVNSRFGRGEFEGTSKKH